MQALNPDHSISSVKRMIGRRLGDEGTEGLTGAKGSPVTLPIHEQNLTPEEISSEILKKLKSIAESQLGQSITRAVITIPAYFNDAQRTATKRAGELAGFTVERVLAEPTAAALSYGLDKLKDRSKVAVYDLGGGTFDLSILELNQGVFQVLSTNGDTRLGGDDLDRKITEHLAKQILEAGGPDVSKEAPLLSRVRESAEQAKIALSTEISVPIALPFLTPSFSFSQILPREPLENLTREIIMRTRAHCLRSLADAKLEAKELNQVILVGGQTRMPLVRKLVAEWFGCADFEEARGGLRIGTEHHLASGPELNTSVNPDEAVALGAAIQAEILSGGFKNVLLLDVTPLSLGIETFGGLMNVIIPRNTTIPFKAGEVFTTAVDNQRSMLIHVVQGERERVRDNWSLGQFEIEFQPAPKGVPRVGVQFEIDSNGVLHVLARDIKTGHQKIVGMKSAVDVRDEDVQRMVEEAVDNAFDDLKARQWIETKVRVGGDLTATRTQMAEYDSELDPEYRSQILEALEAVESVLSQEDPKSKVGDPAALRAASAHLNDVTKPLAEYAMDQILAAELKRRGMIT
jgi:molecular chaperone DnaK